MRVVGGSAAVGGAEGCARASGRSSGAGAGGGEGPGRGCAGGARSVISQRGRARSKGWQRTRVIVSSSGMSRYQRICSRISSGSVMSDAILPAASCVIVASAVIVID